jgi:hypothetical protein
VVYVVFKTMEKVLLLPTDVLLIVMPVIIPFSE